MRSVALPSRALVLATRKSHARASDRPLCMATPFTAATVGLSVLRTARTHAWENGRSPEYVDMAEVWPPPIHGTTVGRSVMYSRLTKSPAQNARPAPVI